MSVRHFSLADSDHYSKVPTLLMLNFLVTLLATLYSILRSRTTLELENLALRHQIGVLQRSARNRRPKLTALDRLLSAWLSRV